MCSWEVVKVMNDVRDREGEDFRCSDFSLFFLL